MNRQEFLGNELRILLGDLSEEEREEAVQYYEDYFCGCRTGDGGTDHKRTGKSGESCPDDPGRIKRGRCRGCVR